MKALLLWDDRFEKRILTEALQMHGLTVNPQAELEQALGQWETQPTEMVVYAQRGHDPIAIAHKIRRFSVAPLLMILNKVGEDTHYDLLEQGVDFVVERPFSTRLFLGYVKVFMRRGQTVLSDSLPEVLEEEVRLDPSRHVVQVGDGKMHRLSQLEFRLLHTLMVHRNQVLSTDTIVEHVWGYTGEGNRDLVRGLINRLRSKVETNRRSPRYIHTVPGVGYTFRTDSG